MVGVGPVLLLMSNVLINHSGSCLNRKDFEMKKPKWAKPLSESDWQHLKESQSAFKQPSLFRFKTDRLFQKNHGEPCPHCRHIDNVLSNNDVKGF